MSNPLVDALWFDNGPFDDSMISGPPDDLCDYAGHTYVEAGGGLLICAVCEDEQWADNATDPDTNESLW